MSIMSIMSINSSLNATSQNLLCATFASSNSIFITYTFVNVLFLVPLYVLVLCTGIQRRRQMASHSDVFTYHMVVVEVVGSLGSLLYSLGIFTSDATLLILGVFGYCVVFPGQTLFHLFTCVDLYLAVIHPVTYLRLRETGGVRIRNAGVFCAWLLISAWIRITHLYLPDFTTTPLISLLGVSVVLTSFCCFSVLHALTQPRPGDKERVDQSKQRAFHITVAIMGALVMRIIALMVSFALSYEKSISRGLLCVMLSVGLSLTLPSSLVLPLLFLHKTGKLACCCQKAESG